MLDDTSPLEFPEGGKDEGGSGGGRGSEEAKEEESQTTVLDVPVPVEMVALQCFGAGVAVGLLLCYFLRSNQE